MLHSLNLTFSFLPTITISRSSPLSPSTKILRENMPKSTPRLRKARQQAPPTITIRARSHRGQLAAPVTAESSNAAGTAYFSNSHDFIVKNPTFYNVQAERDTAARGMEKLSTRIIDGAEYDSSLRDPPPQCHPGTRVQLHGKICAWFRDEEREKALLWLSGPAGVGKSAVIQTLAESLAESKCLGASLFFSRLNNRSDPQHVFLTVAFQLATRIPAYRTYITNEIALNPSLLSKGMKEQFRIFITEPFGNRGIGNGEGPWAVFLDGLDECDDVDKQRRIIQLVSEFVLKFPDAPLVWSISSRPEPHIVETFKDEAIVPSYWSEYIPINSTEACRDVERYLNNSFKALKKQYSFIPSNWPSEIQFLKLSKGALGLFVFANTAVRFMEDPDYADPVSRLSLIVSVIDHLDVKVTDNNHPFALLNALYSQILKSLPPTVWHTTKRILGYTLCVQSSIHQDGLSCNIPSQNLMAASIVLDLERNVIYSSLHKLHSVLQIPQWKDAHKSKVSFLHASFGDYLGDWTRAQEFWINRSERVDEITRCLYQLHLARPWDNNWTTYTSQLLMEKGSFFYGDLKNSSELGFCDAVFGTLRGRRGEGPFVSQQDRSECLDALTEINVINELKSLKLIFIQKFLFGLWEKFSDELTSRGLCKQLQMRDLNLDHLDCGRNKPFVARLRGPNKFLDSPDVLKDFVTKLRSLQERYPKKSVLIFGSTPEKRNAFVWFERGGAPPFDLCSCIPYPY